MSSQDVGLDGRSHGNPLGAQLAPALSLGTERIPLSGADTCVRGIAAIVAAAGGCAPATSRPFGMTHVGPAASASWKLNETKMRAATKDRVMSNRRRKFSLTPPTEPCAADGPASISDYPIDHRGSADSRPD